MSERRKKLLESLKKINKEHGDGLAKFADSHVKKEIIPFGIKELDDFVGGGHNCGNFTVIYGAESTGKSTMVLQAIAHAQKLGKICCYIDLEHSFTKERAEALGVNLSELVLIDTAKDANDSLGIIRQLCIDKVVDVFVIDSVQAMSTKGQQFKKGKGEKLRDLEEKEIAELARVLSKFFATSAPHIYNAKASVIMIGQVRIGGIGTFFTKATMTGGSALKHWASTRLFIRRGQGADAPVESEKVYYPDPVTGKERYKTVKNKIGFDCVVKLEKTKSSDSAQEGSEIHIPFYFKSGFNLPVLDIVDPMSHDEAIEKGKEFIKNQPDHLIDMGLDSGLDEVVTEEKPKQPKKKRGRLKLLKNLKEEEFNDLKKSGMLWEFYPEAPEFFKDINKKDK